MGLGKKILCSVAVAVVAATVAGCFTSPTEKKDPDGDDNVDGVKTLTSITQDTHLFDIESDPTKPDYILVGHASIGAKLTIDPGVVIVAKSGSQIFIEESGSIIAAGTEQKPIKFQGESNTVGFWKGIDVYSNNLQNELTWVEIHNAGSNAFGALSLSGASAKMKITNCAFKKSSTFGLYVNGDITGFQTNRFEENTSGSVCLPPMQVSILDTFSTYNQKVYITDGTVTNSQTWKSLPVIYEVENHILIDEGTLTILPGAKFQFKSDGYFSIGENGAFKAIGTAEKKITFSGTTLSPGHWRGFEVSSGSLDNQFAFVHISYAGSSNDAAVRMWQNSRMSFNNCKFENNKGFGIYTSDNSILPSFSNNEFKGNTQSSLRISASQIKSLDVLSDYSGNGGGVNNDAVHINGGDASGNDNIWRAINVPYIIEEACEIPGEVTVLPGARFLFKTETYIDVNASGKFRAVGKADSLIVFKGLIEAPGQWRGIEISSGSTANELSYCELAHGGRGDFGNINVWDESYAKVTHSIIRDSKNLGIFYRESGTVVQSDNQFTNCPGGDTGE